MKFTHLKLTHPVLVAGIRHGKFQSSDGFEITECPGGYRVAGGALSAPVRVPFHNCPMVIEAVSKEDQAFATKPAAAEAERLSPKQAAERNRRTKRSKKK